MKLKHKKLGVDLEVYEHTEFPHFYITTGGSLIHRNDHDWGLMKEEEWEDITSECKWTDEYHTSFYIRAANGDRIEAYMNGPYRVRKIDGPHNGPCFIVERKKS